MGDGTEPNGISGKVQDPVKITLVPLVQRILVLGMVGTSRVYMEKVHSLCYYKIGFWPKLSYILQDLFEVEANKVYRYLSRSYVPNYFDQQFSIHKSFLKEGHDSCDVVVDCTNYYMCFDFELEKIL